MSSFGERFGHLVREKRQDMTHQELAVLAFRDESKKSRISELETGKVARPHRKTVDALVVALGILDEDINRLYAQTEQTLEKAPIVADPRYIPDLAVFRDVDAPWCPQMVVLPTGEFRMGSPDTDEDADSIFRPGESVEKPQRRVKITYRFAIGRYPVTVREYRRFVEATGYLHDGGLMCFKAGNDAAKSWGDPGFQQTEQHPVVGVNWKDAKAYIEWLSRETNQTYRLPTEAEWEYACRAGTTTRYSFGDWATSADASFDRLDGETTKVGSFHANRWGLYDMHGNVYEWVEDVWHRDYDGEWKWVEDVSDSIHIEPPNDGSAWNWVFEPDYFNDFRVVRGGCWHIPSRCIRSAHRHYYPTDFRNNFTGLRVARTL